MGLLEWFFGKKTDAVGRLLVDRPTAPLPPRNVSIPGALPVFDAGAEVIPRSAFGPAEEQLSHDLCEALALVTDPADRLYVSNAIAAVRAGRPLVPCAVPNDRTRAIGIARDMYALPHDDAASDWLRHRALATAAGAEVLSRGHPEVARDAFVAGLLHDVGRVAMLRIADAGALVPHPAVLEGLIGELHAGFSAVIAERAGLSPQVVAALQFHHLPERGGPNAMILIPPDAERMTYTVAAAGIVTHVVLAQPIDPSRARALEGILAHLGIGAIEEVVLAAQEAFEALVA